MNENANANKSNKNTKGCGKRRKPPKPVRTITKTCCRCDTAKPYTAFNNRKRNKDGKASACRDCEREYRKAYRNSETERKAHRDYMREYMRIRYRTSLKYNLTNRIKARLRATVPGINLSKLFGGVLPYSFKDLCDHLKTRVPEGFGWDDITTGALQLDHIRPIASFNITSPDDADFGHCWKLANLTLLPKEQHERKGAKFNGVNIRRKRCA